MDSPEAVRIFQTSEHACGYWPDRLARELVLDPSDPSLPNHYQRALEMGFRRIGGNVYRPHCSGCRACVPVRIPVREFRPHRSQRRCLSRNADLTTTRVEAEASDEAFSLYRRYLAARHPGGSMDNPSPADFESFLRCLWSPTVLLEFRRNGQLLGVAITDVLPRAFSAVYTFYAPEYAERSLGTYAILSQVAQAREQGCEHLYLGFWLQNHPKMQYKRGFEPLEYLDGSDWQRFGPL
jgi:arginine-tRNA-protein transferase